MYMNYHYVLTDNNVITFYYRDQHFRNKKKTIPEMKIDLLHQEFIMGNVTIPINSVIRIFITRDSNNIPQTIFRDY